MIFLSYRVADTLPTASHLFDRLARRYGKGHVLWDKKRLVIGQAWPDQLRTALDESVVVLALVGPHWDTARLDDPGDWVRIEVLAGHAQGKLYPLLVDGAGMPKPRWDADCPLNAAVAVQGGQLRSAEFDADVAALCAALEDRYLVLRELSLGRDTGEKVRELATAAALVHARVGMEARMKVLTAGETVRQFQTVSTRALPSASLSAATGDFVDVTAHADRDGHLAVLVISPDGTLDAVPLAETAVAANRRVPHRFELTPPAGSEEFVVAWSEAPLPTAAGDWTKFLEELGAPVRGVRSVPQPEAPAAAVVRFSVTHSSGQ